MGANMVVSWTCSLQWLIVIQARLVRSMFAVSPLVFPRSVVIPAMASRNGRLLESVKQFAVEVQDLVLLSHTDLSLGSVNLCLVTFSRTVSGSPRKFAYQDVSSTLEACNVGFACTDVGHVQGNSSDQASI